MSKTFIHDGYGGLELLNAKDYQKKDLAVVIDSPRPFQALKVLENNTGIPAHKTEYVQLEGKFWQEYIAGNKNVKELKEKQFLHNKELYGEDWAKAQR